MPGFRSGTRWKQVLAVIGYLVIFSWILQGISNPYLGIFAVLVFLAVLLVTDGWHLRSRTPLFNSSNKAVAATTWGALSLAVVLAGVAEQGYADRGKSGTAVIPATSPAVPPSPVGGAAQPPPPQCTVQMNGHGMFASAKGGDALAACAGWKAAGHDGTATGDDVCKYSFGELSIQVRDTGLHIYGDPLCAALKWWSSKGGPVPLLDGSVPAGAGSCIVKINNHDMLATAAGPGHEAACLEWRRAGAAVPSASGDVVCDYTSSAGLEVTVRDSGGHSLGNNLCRALANWKTKGGDPPDYTATCSSFTSLMTKPAGFHDLHMPDDAVNDPKRQGFWDTNEVTVQDLSDYFKCAMTTQGWTFVPAASSPIQGGYGFSNWYCLPNGAHPPPASYDVVGANPDGASDQTTAKRAAFSFSDDVAPEDHCP